MWWFTLFFGIIGLHHVFLRSPQSGLIFFIINILTLGYPWFYDLIQLSSYGGVNLESLNKYGLDHPWGALGLAQGMWVDGNAPEKEPTKNSPPSPWFFLLYALLIPVGVISNLVAGDIYNAAGRFGFLIFIPFGFLITFFAIFYDYFQLFASPADLTFNGTKRIFPWPAFMDPDSHSPNIMAKIEVKICPKESIITAIFNVLYKYYETVFKLGTGAGMIVAPEIVIPFIAGVDAGERVLDNTLELATEAVVDAGKIIETVEDVAENTIVKGVKIASEIGHLASSAASVASVGIPSVLPPISSLASANAPKPVNQIQTGGAQNKNTLDYFAFGSMIALVAGGLLLTANRKFRDAASD